MKRFLILLLAAIGATAAWGQTNATNAAAGKPPEQKPAQQEIGLTSGHFIYDGGKRVVIYFDHVVVTNFQGRLTCERLTIDLPPEGSTNNQPTNAVAETNVVINFINKGDTNHVTCDRAVYAYSVVNAVTNNTITFHGSTNSPAEVQNSKGTTTGEPLVYDLVSGQFSGVNTVMHFLVPSGTGNGTNSSPLNLFNAH
jgi:lipopolysaccharide export system protein LptA